MGKYQCGSSALCIPQSDVCDDQEDCGLSSHDEDESSRECNGGSCCYWFPAQLRPPCLITPMLENFHENRLIVEKYCVCLLERRERYFVVKKWNDSIINYHYN